MRIARMRGTLLRVVRWFSRFEPVSPERLLGLWTDVDHLEEDVVRRGEHDLVVGLSLSFGEFRAVAWSVEERRHAAPLQEGRGGVNVLLLIGADGDVIHSELIVVGLMLAGRRREPERDLSLDTHAQHLVVF